MCLCSGIIYSFSTRIHLSPVKYEILSPRCADIKIEQLLLNLEAGNENSMQPLTHFGEEIALVLSGAVGVELNGNINELNVNEIKDAV